MGRHSTPDDGPFLGLSIPTWLRWRLPSFLTPQSCSFSSSRFFGSKRSLSLPNLPSWEVGVGVRSNLCILEGKVSTYCYSEFFSKEDFSLLHLFFYSIMYVFLSAGAPVYLFYTWSHSPALPYLFSGLRCSVVPAPALWYPFRLALASFRRAPTSFCSHQLYWGFHVRWTLPF